LVAEVSYTVNVTRTDKVWHVHVVEIDRVTQARTLAEVPGMAADLIDIMTGESDAELAVEVDLPETAAKHLAEAQRLRRVEAEARSAAATELREAAVELKRQGLSMRDLGEAIGVSHQRASQLTSGRA
jgi:predicted RNase H-like HicB family nuclease